MPVSRDSIGLTSGQTYQPSGHVTPHGTLMMLLFGSIAAVVIGVVYAYLVEYNPLVYFNFIGTLIFGGGMGLAVSAGVRAGKVRSPSVAFATSIVACVIGLYVTWVVWMHAHFARVDQDIWMFQPLQLFDAMCFVAEQGAWSIRSYTPTGAVLWGVWVLEALVITGVAVAVGVGSAREPFCESCGEWAKDVFSGLRLGRPEAVEQLRMKLQAGDVQALSTLPAPEEDAFTEVALSTCPACGEVGYLKVEAATVTTDRKGKARASKSTVVERLLLAGPELETVLNLGQPDTPAAAPVATTSPQEPPASQHEA